MRAKLLSRTSLRKSAYLIAPIALLGLLYHFQKSLEPDRAFSATPQAKNLGSIQVNALPLSMEIRVSDANPRFLPGSAEKYFYNEDGIIRDTELRGGDFYQVSSELFRIDEQSERKGAVADGQSYLLIRARANQPGKFKISVVETPGTDNGKIKMLASSIGEEWYYGLAIYIPPESFGRPQAATGKEQRTRTARNEGKQNVRRLNIEYREVDLEVAWDGEQNARQVERHKIRLYRPPVVLVHGTYDAAISCWDWDGGTEAEEGDLYKKKARQEAGGIQGRSPYDTPSFAKQLEQLGFVAFIVNYKQSSGTDPHAFATPLSTDPVWVPAIQDYAFPPDLAQRIEAKIRFFQGRGLTSNYFRDNEKVAWHGGRDNHNDKGEGIDDAFKFFRNELKIAVTKADVVGHSMGGVLARVYARGFSLPEPEYNAPDFAVPNPSAIPAQLQTGGDWYRRRNNWLKGDINRLITIGSTHKGSHIPGLLQHYTKHSPYPLRDALWQIGNWVAVGKFAPGAFTDQIPESRALRALGQTKVPAHAIAGVAKVKDLDKFDGIPGEDTYRARMMKVWEKTWKLPEPVLRTIFRFHTGSEADADEVIQLGFKIARLENERTGATVQQRGKDLAFPHMTAEEKRSSQQEWERIARIPSEIAMLKERAFLWFVSVAFHNDWTDFTVSLDSQLGGLKEPYITVFPNNYTSPAVNEGVLHGFEPRHKDIQRKVIELLQGGIEGKFDRNGFPPSTMPKYVPPAQAGFKPHLTATCDDSPELCGGAPR